MIESASCSLPMRIACALCCACECEHDAATDGRLCRRRLVYRLGYWYGVACCALWVACCVLSVVSCMLHVVHGLRRRCRSHAPWLMLRDCRIHSPGWVHRRLVPPHSRRPGQSDVCRTEAPERSAARRIMSCALGCARFTEPNRMEPSPRRAELAAANACLLRPAGTERGRAAHISARTGPSPPTSDRDCGTRPHSVDAQHYAKLPDPNDTDSARKLLRIQKRRA